MQATQFYHTIVILFALMYLLLEEFLLLILGHIFEVLLNRLFPIDTIIFSILRHVADVVNALGMLTQNTIKVAFCVATQQDVGTTTSHIGSNRYSSATSGLRHNLRLTLVIFRIQNVMRNTLQIEQMREMLRGLDRRGSNQYRLALLVTLLDLLNHRFEFRIACAVDQVCHVLADHWLVGWNNDHIQLVDFMELFSLSESGTGHTCQLLIQTEVVLERDRCQSMVLTLYNDAFFGLDCLV